MFVLYIVIHIFHKLTDDEAFLVLEVAIKN